jgi:hypothetical protein
MARNIPVGAVSHPAGSTRTPREHSSGRARPKAGAVEQTASNTFTREGQVFEDGFINGSIEAVDFEVDEVEAVQSLGGACDGGCAELDDEVESHLLRLIDGHFEHFNVSICTDADHAAINAVSAAPTNADDLQASLAGLTDDEVIDELFAYYHDWFMGHPGGLSSDIILSLNLTASQRRGLLKAMEDLTIVCNPAVARGGGSFKRPPRNGSAIG